MGKMGIMEGMSTTHNLENCMVCGSRLDYRKKSGEMTCAYCGRVEQGHITCPDGHFICEACHGRDAMQAIENLAFSAGSPDPLEIAEFMMSIPNLPMLGCQHAFIAAGSFMAGLKNVLEGRITDEDIREVFNRTEKQAVSGYCGLTGVCGIAPAIGACFSVFLGSRCGSDSEQKITMEAVTRAATAMMELTGPSCCKAYVRSSLLSAVELFEEKFGIVLPVGNPAVICKQVVRHPHGCRGDRCPYYKAEVKDVFADAVHMPVTVCHT